MPLFVRYLLPLSGAPFSGEDIFLLHWDDDEGTSRGVFVELWTFDVSGTEAIFFSRTEFPSVSASYHPVGYYANGMIIGLWLSVMMILK